MCQPLGQKLFTVSSFNPHNNPVRQVQLSLFYVQSSVCEGHFYLYFLYQCSLPLGWIIEYSLT